MTRVPSHGLAAQLRQTRGRLAVTPIWQVADLLRDAADEIERLTAAIRDHRDSGEHPAHCRPCDEVCGELDEALWRTIEHEWTSHG